MEIHLNLSGVSSKAQLLSKFGEVFEFGGPNGNRPVVTVDQGNGWGLNWDALTDSLRHLQSGGIWGTSRIFEFPLKVIIENTDELEEKDSKSFQILQEILMESRLYHKARGYELEIEYR